jgi:hypothetical protein
VPSVPQAAALGLGLRFGIGCRVGGNSRFNYETHRESQRLICLPLVPGCAVVDGWTTPLSRLVVPMLVVLALILFIITLVVGVVDDVLLKLLLLDKTLLLFWCAADDDCPLASVGFDARVSSG